MSDECETAARAIDASVIICGPAPDERAEIARIFSDLKSTQEFLTVVAVDFQ